MADRIQLRRDTKANWELYNPILMEGEPGMVLDYPSLYKMGDGVNHWSDLPYRGFDGNIVQETGQSATSVMSQKAVSDAVSKVNSKVGYYVCSTEANVAAKAIQAAGYALESGGTIKVKMTYGNTSEDTITMNINGTGAVALYYDGAAVTNSNTWADGETVEIYYDGEKFLANNVAGGGTFATGEKVREVGIDLKPRDNSTNLPTSGGVAAEIAKLREDVYEVIEGYKPIVIEGDVVNAADEEDLTSVDNGSGTNVLKFKDKDYNAILFSGLGKVHLRKNIVNGDNVLTQTMVNRQNTVYIIQYDYKIDTNGITIPANSVLLFDGGTLTSGAMTCNDTLIIDTFNRHPEENVTITGNYTYFNSEANASEIIEIVNEYLQQFAANYYDKETIDEKLDALEAPTVVNGRLIFPATSTVRTENGRLILTK